jgi:hypothetical protein
MTDNKLASRKFILTSVTTLLLFAVLVAGILPVAIFQNLLGIIITGYLIANTTQNIAIAKENV